MADRHRILVVFGTRPEAIKLFPVIDRLRAMPGVEVRVCVTGQHRGLLDQVLQLAGLVPDRDLDLMRDDQPLDALTARLLEAIGAVIAAERPDRVVVQGDTATAMAAALAAYVHRVPVAHVEAGLRSDDLYHPWPEEGNRRMIGTIADLHFAPTETAAAALRAENVPPGRIHVTGNTVIDALHMVAARVAAQPLATAAIDALAARFAGRRLIVVTAHRRENLGEGLAAIAGAVATVAARRDVAFVLPLHPNPQVRAPVLARLAGHDNVAIVDPLDYGHFIRLLTVAHIVLTDSGGVQEEAPALGKPVLVARRTTERPEGVIAGTARLVGTDSARIVEALTTLLDDPHAYAAMARAHHPFGDGRASERIARLLLRATA